MLRTRTLVQINEVVQKTKYFHWEDFKIESSDGSTGTQLGMTYLYNPEFLLTLQIPVEKTMMNGGAWQFRINGTTCPGEVSHVEPAIRRHQGAAMGQQMGSNATEQTG
ncbi:MAG TPA: hypothetical protein VMR62_06320 [Bryobacteraceae bacterium]|nr:hypothetical protein [Bryobacteraceae bacterium]